MALWDLTINDPYREMRRLQRDMDRLFSNFPIAGQETPRLTHGQETEPGTKGKELTTAKQQDQWFWPLVNVKEGDKAITINAELPGMRKEDVDVRMCALSSCTLFLIQNFHFACAGEDRRQSAPHQRSPRAREEGRE